MILMNGKKKKKSFWLGATPYLLMVFLTLSPNGFPHLVLVPKKPRC